MIELALAVLVNQCSVLLLDLGVVFLNAAHVIDHQTSFGSYSKDLHILNVLADVSGKVRLQRV